MSFWNTSDGSNATQVGTEYETGGGGFLIIPDGSVVGALVDDAKWAEDKQGSRYIEVTYNCVKPEVAEGTKIRQKLYVTDLDTSAKNPDAKRDKALRTLAAIDANAGGKLAQLGVAPQDNHLQKALINKQMAITVRLMKGEDGSEFNWVSGVHPKTKDLVLKGEVRKKELTPKTQQQTKADDWGSSSSKSDDGIDWGTGDGDDVPF